jgi:hypothetical protein
MEFNFKSKLIFDSNNDIQPDNYYLNEIIDLLHKTCKNKKINIGFEPCDGGGTGGQGCGNVWNAYEYYFNNIKKIILISSTHVGLDIEIEINIIEDLEKNDYLNYKEMDNYAIQIIEIIKNKINEWRD